jgi:hypothetical protein
MGECLCESNSSICTSPSKVLMQYIPHSSPNTCCCRASGRPCGGALHRTKLRPFISNRCRPTGQSVGCPKSGGAAPVGWWWWGGVIPAGASASTECIVARGAVAFSSRYCTSSSYVCTSRPSFNLRSGKSLAKTQHGLMCSNVTRSWHGQHGGRKDKTGAHLWMHEYRICCKQMVRLRRGVPWKGVRHKVAKKGVCVCVCGGGGACPYTIANGLLKSSATSTMASVASSGC